MVRTVLVLLAGIISISFAAIFIRFCDDVPAIMIATYRLTLASLILLGWSRIKGHSFRRPSRRELGLCIAGGVFLSLHFITWITSLKYTSVASSTVLVTTNPIFVGIFSYLLFREKQPAALVVGIVLSFAGSVLIALGDSGLHQLAMLNRDALIGDILALVGATMASGYLIVGSKAREQLDTFDYVTIVYTISAVLLLLTSFGLGLRFTGYRAPSYIFMLLLAIVPQLIGHTSFNWALKHLRSSMVAVTILGEPIGASILAFFFFAERIDAFQFIGIILIFGAIIIASRQGRKLPAPSRVDLAAG
jgi:drug/metabolite transporter (DMT)-like permease